MAFIFVTGTVISGVALSNSINSIPEFTFNFQFLVFDPALLSLSLTYILPMTDVFSYFLLISIDVEGLVRIFFIIT